MRFKGDIIITDPCYICKEKQEVGEYPVSNDYFSYSSKKDYPDYKKSSCESKQYREEWKRYFAALSEYRDNNISDWELCNYGEDMEVLGIKNYICIDTLYGDWSCTTYNSDTHEKIGEFCADAGMVGVFLLDEVLKYNPDFNYHIERPWTTTLIKDFDGEIDFEIIHTEGVYEDDTEFHSKGEKWEDDSVIVVGRGNINFETHQTGF